tara:strand:+ start:1090 stop:1530 length:441 start_codon:yes stop_codon:yes gene_type:complete
MNIKNAEVYGKTKWIEPGDYVLEIAEVQFRESSRHRGRVYFQVFFTIIESNNSDYAVGSRCGWQVDLSKEETAASNVKGFLMGCMEGVEATDIDNEFAAKLVDDGALISVVVVADAFHITTKAGTPFTVVRWSPYKGDDADAGANN